MNISCPLCSTSIEVSKFLVGQKGRCPRCSSKFIIPESPDDEIEMLETGEIPEGEPEPAPPPPPAEKKKSKLKSDKPKNVPPSAPPRVSAGGRRVMPATGAPARTAARPVVVKHGSGAFGFLFAIVFAALVGVVVYVMMDKKGTGDVADNNGDDTEKPIEAEVVEPAPVAPVEPIAPVENPDPDGIPVYAKVVQPILDSKCTSCHGEEKAKGRLAMHNYEKLLAGSGNGVVIGPDPDDPKRIEILYRAELPEADDEHMPPTGKPQLTADELAIIKWWINAGGNPDIDSNEAPEEVRKKIQALAKL